MSVIYVWLTQKKKKIVLSLDKIKATCFFFAEMFSFCQTALKAKAKKLKKACIHSPSSHSITKDSETADAFVHYYTKALQI